MPFATADDGVRLHYEVDGAEGAPPLLLHHGFGGNLDDWRDFGYVERLRDRFRLILIDGRGHGRSDKPLREEDYDFRTRVLDVVAVLRDAGHERAHFLGYSLGGTVGLSALIYAPQRFESTVIGGASPYGGRDLVMKSIGFERIWNLISTWAHNDNREAMSAHFDAQMKFEGAVQALRTTAVRHLLYAGTDDRGPHRGLREFAGKYGAPHFTIEGKDHVAAMVEAAAEVVPRVVAFLDGA